MCFFACVIQCLRMYLCNFHYKCVRHHTHNCATIGELAFSTVLIIQIIARMTSDAQQENVHRHCQRRPLKNGRIRHMPTTTTTTPNCPRAISRLKSSEQQQTKKRQRHRPRNNILTNIKHYMYNKKCTIS